MNQSKNKSKQKTAKYSIILLFILLFYGLYVAGKEKKWNASIHKIHLLKAYNMTEN